MTDDERIDKVSGVVAMTFGEGRGDTVEDLSSHGNDGQFAQDPQWIDGKVNGAIELDGASWIDVGDDDSLSLTGSDVTILAWVSFGTEVAGRPGRAIVGRDEGGGQFNKWLFRYWDEGIGEGRTLNWHINEPGAGAIQINSSP